MRVISPRRSSTTAAGSGSLYGTSTSTTAGTSSGSGLSSYNTSSATSNGLGLSKYSSHYDRASSLSKVLPSSSTSSSYTTSSYLSPSYSAYTPRTSTHRSSLSSASSASAYLSGGASSGLGSYHRSTPSYLSGSSGSSYDSTTLGRYGLPRKTKGSSITSTDSLRKDDYRHEARKPPTATGRTSSATALNDENSSGGSGVSDTRKRLSGSCSSSSLARLVATSGLDMYEKYSPATYKTNCELSRSRSAVGSDTTDNDAAINSNNNNNNISSSSSNNGSRGSSNNISTTCTVTLDRPRSRYSRLYSNDADGGSTGNSGSGSGSINNSTGTENKDYSSNTYTSDSAGRLSRNRSSGKFSLSNSGSSGDIPTATFTLRSNRPRSRTQREQQDTKTERSSSTASVASLASATTTTTTTGLTNGTLEHNGTTDTTSINGIDSHLNGLKLTLSASSIAATSTLADKESNKSSNNISTDTTDDAGGGIVVPGIDASDCSNDISTAATIKLDGSPTTQRRSSSKVTHVRCAQLLP